MCVLYLLVGKLNGVAKLDFFGFTTSVTYQIDLKRNGTDSLAIAC